MQENATLVLSSYLLLFTTHLLVIFQTEGGIELRHKNHYAVRVPSTEVGPGRENLKSVLPSI